jgi:hypothetical protein
MTLTGQCRCARVTYTLDTNAPLAVYACHCRHCQTWSGSAFALHALLPADALRVGTLDESPSVQPMAHIWLRHKQPWITLAEGVPTWPESPTPQAFAQALSAPL